MASSIEEFRNTARRSGALLITLSETEGARLSLDLTNRHLRDIDKQLQTTKSYIQIIGNVIQKELRRILKDQTSIVRRWVCGVASNEAQFEPEVEKKGIYAQSLKSLREANILKRELLAMRAAAIGEQSRLREACKRRTTAQREFDALYASMFPDDPSLCTEIDEAEDNVETARRACEDSYIQRKKSLAVERLLKHAFQSIETARSYFLQIPRALEFRLYKGSVLDEMLRLILVNIMTHEYDARKSVARARGMSEEPIELPPLNVPLGQRIDHEQIKNLRVEFGLLSHALEAKVVAAKERSRLSVEQETTNARLLERAKEKLRRERQKLVRFLADDNSWDTVPPYSADDYPLVPPMEEEES
ncbi:hypothetical protein F5Y09DRAFT_344841 [Xylaria sp. FL1042]|nr:hypothetical protein F5Y09DRAFT_344841 [Xylaria sp. FL1042]